MSRARGIFPGDTVMITRRTTQQQFLLLPTAKAKLIFMYCLGLALQETSILLHAVNVMSNHYHIIATDPFGQLPKFIYTLNKYVAKCMNAHLGRWENFFAGGAQTSIVRLTTQDAILEKTVYAVTNPVAAHLVKRSASWPGLLLWRPGTYKAKRPDVFFNPDGNMPKTLPVRISPLPIMQNVTVRQQQEVLGKAIADKEAQIRADARRTGKTFVGVRGVLAQKTTDTPRSVAKRRGLSPRVAGRDKWRRIEMLQRLKDFEDQYNEALPLWRAGKRDVVFPYGTYKMRVVHGVKVAEP